MINVNDDDSFFETTAVEVFFVTPSRNMDIWVYCATLHGHSFSAFFFPFRLYIALTLRHIFVSPDIKRCFKEKHYNFSYFFTLCNSNGIKMKIIKLDKTISFEL